MTKINQEEYKFLKNLDGKWKWIARDDSKSLFIFVEKPYKKNGMKYWDVSNYTAELVGSIESDLFQFIQWEDLKPYNISELIEEYEHKEFYDYVGWEYAEREETEVKKDIDWLKREIHKELEDWHGVEGGIDGDGINEIMLLINQHEESEVKRLDRKIKELESYNDELIRDNNQLRNAMDNQEVLSQEWIDDESMSVLDTFNRHRLAVPVDKLQSLLVPKQEVTEEQVTEYLRERGMTAVDSALVYRENLDNKTIIEKPTIPEFVAEFLDGKENYALYELLDSDFIYDSHDELARWLYDNDEKTNRERELSLVLAHIYGYEVEMEQRYYVMNNDNRMMLVRMMDGKTITEADPFKLEDMYEGEKESHRLTEKEIKNYDERYWAFRKPVEELE